MENFTFVYKEKKSVPFRIAASLVTILGIYSIQYFLFGGILLSAGSFIYIIYNEGIELNLKDHKYRNTTYLGTIAMGNWKELPEIIYISVFQTLIVSSIYGMSGASVSNRENVILINLIHGSNQQILVYKTEDINDAFEKAEYISQELDVRIYDATDRVGKWHERKQVV